MVSLVLLRCRARYAGISLALVDYSLRLFGLPCLTYTLYVSKMNNRHGRRVYSTHMTINLLVMLPPELQFFFYGSGKFRSMNKKEVLLQNGESRSSKHHGRVSVYMAGGLPTGSYHRR